MYTRYTRIVQLLALGALALGTIASGSATISAASPRAAAQVAAATPRAAVLKVIRPFYVRSAGNAACNASKGKLAACPMTPRLRAAAARELQWERKHTRGGNGNEFCRCQNTPQRVVISGVKAPYVNASGKFAEVETVWYWGGSTQVNLTWVTRHVAGGWQVDNSFCSGYPNKDLYHIPVGPCPGT